MSSISAAAILVVDEREIEARGIKSALLSRGCSDVRYCFSESEAVSAMALQSFDLILIHQSIGTVSGIALASQLRALVSAQCAIVILAEDATWSLALEVEKSAANGLLSTGMPFETLLNSLDGLLGNPDRFIFIGVRGESELIDELTSSEREVLHQLAQGLTTREIAQERHNSEATIKSHLTSIYRKLGARNRVEAIAHIKNQ